MLQIQGRRRRLPYRVGNRGEGGKERKGKERKVKKERQVCNIHFRFRRSRNRN